MNKELIDKIKDRFPTGTRVELIHMEDVQAPPMGTQGTVKCIDDIGTIHINWDNGSTLGVVPGEDVIRKVETDGNDRNL